jgi:hypothetical protein
VSRMRVVRPFAVMVNLLLPTTRTQAKVLPLTRIRTELRQRKPLAAARARPRMERALPRAPMALLAPRATTMRVVRLQSSCTADINRKDKRRPLKRGRCRAGGGAASKKPSGADSIRFNSNTRVLLHGHRSAAGSPCRLRRPLPRQFYLEDPCEE